MGNARSGLTYVGTYVDVKGPGYDKPGIKVYRSNNNRLRWTSTSEGGDELHPATLTIEPAQLRAVLVLLNRQTGQKVSVPIPLPKTIKVPDSLDSRVLRLH